MTMTCHEQSVIRAMYLGLGLNVVATIVAFVDHATANTLAEHIQAGYPTYSRAHIGSAVAAYLIYLSVVGALGIVWWIWTIWAIKADMPWARGAVMVTFALGTAIALFDLLVKDTSGKSGLPPLLGWARVLPCVAGLLAVVPLWRRS